MKRAHFRHGTADAGPPDMHIGHSTTSSWAAADAAASPASRRAQ